MHLGEGGDTLVFGIVLELLARETIIDNIVNQKIAIKNVIKNIFWVHA